MQIARGLAALVSAMALSFSSYAYAATVVPGQGIVLVNQGNGYANVTEPTTVNPGDIVVVNPGGSAQLTYPDGCSLPVAVGAVVTVGAQSPCKTQGSLIPTQAIIPPQDNVPPGQGGGTPPTTAVVPDGTGLGEFLIGVTVAGGVVTTLILTQPDKSASP
jgi:hypothetical protein